MRNKANVVNEKVDQKINFLLNFIIKKLIEIFTVLNKKY